MKVSLHAKHGRSYSNYGTLHGLRPPFLCPWKSEGCKWISMDQKKHQQHIREEHELPGLRERGMKESESGRKL